jgi:hypothetical protein
MMSYSFRRTRFEALPPATLGGWGGTRGIRSGTPKLERRPFLVFLTYYCSGIVGMGSTMPLVFMDGIMDAWGG